MGAGWPPRSNNEQQTVQQLDMAQSANSDKLDDLCKVPSDSTHDGEELGFCNVWVGTTQERHEFMDEPATRRLMSQADEGHLLSPSAGTTLIYFPFVANEKVPGVDPLKSDFMSTWNFVYTPEEIDKVVGLARANFEEGKEQTRRTIRAVWERKRMLRLQRQKEEQEFRKTCLMRSLGRGGDIAIM